MDHRQKLPDNDLVEKTIKRQFDKAREEIIDLCMEKLHINDDKKTMRIWPRKIDLDDLLDFKLCELPFDFVVDRDPCNGDVLAYREVLKNEEVGNDRTSLSLTRAPGPPDEGIMGSASKFPFFPGGMEEVFQQALKKQKESLSGQTKMVDFENNLLSIPPGFEKGVDFKAKKQAQKEEATRLETATKNKIDEPIGGVTFDENSDILSIMNMISGVGAMPFDFADVEESGKIDKEKVATEVQVGKEIGEAESAVDEVIAKPIIIGDTLAKRKLALEGVKHEFAEVLDVNQPVKDFDEKVPNMAYQYPFELDIFQKQAIIHLEKGDSVFVAAHTSAGKTVVAEYAIALCKKHLTRAIYTSPIKALSNQKFRDFKQTFHDVGLITGDIQIQTDAFCLIMTTEILRSMLYNGSDVVREVEWVIFDEVHYINDAERGVVWEEVLIMLPRHVKIIMLSATVPNCADFADWVGRIKDRKVYVISTPKRPVPLEHFLYTGKDGKTKDQRYKLVDSNGTFLNHGYIQAVEALKEKKPNSQTGPKHQAMSNPKTDRNIWITLIDHLKTKDLLPMVAFTFSRKRCDDNAAMLTSVDLTGGQEKTEIHHFFSRCMKQLKGTDRKLPQVLQMQDLCKRGLAVHHSGILPILKEVVEMLFQLGYVKVLFATETFAMGVNMPARTVVFDSMRKHDGREFRDLKPGEYTQMAGRAGRRGKDKTGTVILLCKGQVPDMSELHKMMKGKADELISKFRVTYSLVLNSLRVEKIRIEDILQRSFAESVTLRNRMKLNEAEIDCKKQLDKAEKLNCQVCSDLETYYDYCREIVGLSEQIMNNGFWSNPIIAKQMTPGRLILFAHGLLRNCVGILLKVVDKNSLQVLVPDMKDVQYFMTVPELQSIVDEQQLAIFDFCFLKGQLAQPTGDDLKHSVKNILVERISGISSKNLKISADTILDDWQRRQQPRFRSSSPDRTTLLLLRELGQLIAQGSDALNFLDPIKDIQSQNIDLMANIQKLKKFKSNMANFECVNCLSFQEHFLIIHRYNQLATKYQQLRFESSPESLLQMDNYKNKLNVLKALQYVDENNVVKLKGKVACSMSVFGLMVTELMFENVLSPLPPAEIAAALSFTTCQGVPKRNDEHLHLPERLIQIRDQIYAATSKIYKLHEDNKIENDDFGEELRFELMEVVYEWARGTPFCKIMEMTEAQEGIIVRCIQRLDEVCRDVRNAARLVGDPTLQQKMEEMSTLIKRDIVFAASLYTTTA